MNYVLPLLLEGLPITLFDLLDEFCWAAIDFPSSDKVVDNAQH